MTLRPPMTKRARSILLAAAVMLSATAAQAQSGRISTLEAQEGLVWTGFYDGQINGRRWPSDAIRRFQREIGSRPTGVLTGSQAALLADRAEAARRAVGYVPHYDRATGVRVGLPRALASRAESTAVGTRFTSADGRLEIELARFPGVSTWSEFIAEAKASRPEMRVTYTARGDSWLVVTGFMGPRQFYSRMQRTADGIHGFAVTYDGRIEQVIEPVIVAMSSDFARPELLARE